MGPRPNGRGRTTPKTAPILGGLQGVLRAPGRGEASRGGEEAVHGEENILIVYRCQRLAGAASASRGERGTAALAKRMGRAPLGDADQNVGDERGAAQGGGLLNHNGMALGVCIGGADGMHRVARAASCGAQVKEQDLVGAVVDQIVQPRP